jgi:Flp pilus assembly pilin Flp
MHGRQRQGRFIDCPSAETIRRFAMLFKDTRGADLFEYAILIAVGLGIAAIIFAFRDLIGQAFAAGSAALNW